MAMMGSDEQLLQSALEKLGFMQFIPSDVFEGLKLKFNKVTFEAGDSVLKQGRSGGAFFVLATGTVSVWADKAPGDRLKIASINPTTYFGEIALIEGSERIATLIADEYVEVLVLGKKDFFELLFTINEIKKIIEKKATVRKKDTGSKLLVTAEESPRALTPLKKPSVKARTARTKISQEPPVDVADLYKDEGPAVSVPAQGLQKAEPGRDGAGIAVPAGDGPLSSDSSAPEEAAAGSVASAEMAPVPLIKLVTDSVITSQGSIEITVTVPEDPASSPPEKDVPAAFQEAHSAVSEERALPAMSGTPCSDADEDAGLMSTESAEFLRKLAGSG